MKEGRIKKALRKIDWRIALTGIISITILESIALIKSIDGALFTLAIVAVAGIAGFKLKR